MNSPPDVIRVGIVGLGHIGKVHLAAIASLPGFQVSALCDQDPALAALAPGGAPFFTDIAAFMACPMDVMVVATPSRTHGQIALEALRQGHAVIVEKPAAESMAELDAMMLASQSGQRLHFAFHAAHGREVVWTRDWLRGEGATLGPVTEFDCAFVDPYAVAGGELAPQASSLGDAWRDSGINALSVLAEFIDIAALTAIRVDVPRRSVRGVATEISAAFVFDVAGRSDLGRGVITTLWTTDIDHKHTRLGFSGSGKALLLDHSGQKAILHAARDQSIVLADFSDSGERLHNHYLGVFSSYAANRDDGSTQLAAGRRLHQILFAVAAAMDRPGSVLSAQRSDTTKLR